MKRKTSKLAITLLLCVMCIFVTCFSAFANEEVPIPEFGSTGSISVTIKAYGDGDIVTGGQLELYQLALLEEHDDNTFEYKYINDIYTDTGIVINDEMSASDADMFYEVIKENGIKPISTEECTDKTVFNDIDLGVYLIVQSKSADDYEAINPFIVTVPMFNGTEYVYDVDASPKTEPVNSITTEEPPEVSEPKVSEPTVSPEVSKNVNNGNEGNGGDIPTGDPLSEILRYALGAGIIAGTVILVNLICGKRKAGECDE